MPANAPMALAMQPRWLVPSSPITIRDAPMPDKG